MDNINILVAEDDMDINRLVTRYLIKEGYNVEGVHDGREALRYITSRQYHLIVLDLMMPHINGFDLLRKIREIGNKPVLILSARSEDSDKIEGLGLGADDYISKPFNIEELVARVKAQLRRYLLYNIHASPNSMILQCMDIIMNPANYEITISGKPVILTAKEFDILKLFMENPRRVFTKQQIFNAIWGEDFISDENTVMVHIRRLREKIEVDPSNPRYIHTVWGIGYKLAEV